MNIWCMDATTPHFLLWTDPKSEFSNVYNSVILKVKIYEKISKHWELLRQFKNAKIFQQKNWEDFFKNIWKYAIFNNGFFLFFLNCRFSNIFFKNLLKFFVEIFFAFLNWRSNSHCLLIFSLIFIVIWKFWLWISRGGYSVWKRGGQDRKTVYTFGDITILTYVLTFQKLSKWWNNARWT